jgi:RNA polymerase sigma-70 factor (ECF subfamily)
MTTLTKPDFLAERVYTEYRKKIYGYINSHGIPPSDRDDVFGDIMLKVTRYALRYDADRASLATWVYTVARSAVADYLRKRRPEYPLTEAETAAVPGPEDMTDYEAELDELARLLEHLPERERRVIVLRLYREMDYSAIALRLNTTEVNARKIYSRAIKRIRNDWNE